MADVVISGSGFYAPDSVISNEEIVESFNSYVDKYNALNKHNVDAKPLKNSDVNFIKKASGIMFRHVIEKEGILDVNVMRSNIQNRPDDMTSIQAELAVHASEEALNKAGKKPTEIDAVIVAASCFQRSYPAIAIEVQALLGIKGFAFDMNVACSSATFAIATAESLIKTGAASKVLLINPEIMTAMTNFRDRDSHFIFGDAASALVLEGVQDRQSISGFKIISSKLNTTFSNNIRFNMGYMDRLLIDAPPSEERLFRQNGRKVFKDVTKAVIALLREQIDELCLTPQDFKRLWLHQANSNMNRIISNKFFGEEVDDTKAPNVLGNFANTGAAGSVIAFDLHHEDFESGEHGLLASYGAGYSIGSIVLEKI